jgi:hypothetical protein
MPLSDSFVQSVLMLVLTALLTGFLIPYIFKRIDDERTRQARILADQVAFFWRAYPSCCGSGVIWLSR